LESHPLFSQLSTLDEGTDVTQLLNIKKYDDTEDETPSVKKKKTSTGISFSEALPDGPPVTDEPRAQSHVWMVKALKGQPWVATLKYDGSSMTFCLDPVTSEFMILSRNWVVTDKCSSYYDAARTYFLENKMKNETDLVFQAEVYGPKIQKNRLNVSCHTIAVFNIWSRSRKSYLNHDECIAECARLDLPMVSVIYEGDSFDKTIPELLEMAKGNYEYTTNAREGLVIRPRVEQRVLNQRLSFKVINNDYLLGK
jgi:RNA ligase (TIGR02306 family)